MITYRLVLPTVNHNIIAGVFAAGILDGPLGLKLPSTGDAATHRACSVGLQTMAKDLYTGLTFKDPDGLATSRGPLRA